MRISTGNQALNDFLGGGYETGIITTIYGPPGTGKTTLLIMAAAALPNKNILWIDTESSFSIERLKQITPHHKQVLERSTFFRPTTLQEQRKAIDAIRLMATTTTGLIVVDSIGALYRLELSKTTDPYLPSRELGLQLSYLAETARKQDIPILVTTHVYPDFTTKHGIKIVGGEIIKYSSKCLIHLDKQNNQRTITLAKHRSLPLTTHTFTITNNGIELTPEP